MKSAEKIEQLVKKIRFSPRACANERILEYTEAVLKQKVDKAKSDRFELNIWRIIMNKPITKITTVAAVLVIIASTVALLDHLAKPAYAIEQTIEAMRNIITVHFFARDWQNRELETWIKVNPETGGNDCHYLNEPELGQISISTPEITYFYHPEENKVRIVEGQALRSDVRFGRFIEDVLDKLIEPEHGEIQINKEYDPNTAKEVIILWAESSEYEIEAFIDPETKLPIRINFAKAIPGQIIKSIDEIYYNEPLPEGLFDFEIPEGAQVIREQSLLPLIDDPNYGISAENLSQEEARIKIIKEFWSYVIDRNFEAAHKLLPVASPQKIESVLANKWGGGATELINIGESFKKQDCSLGLLTPVQVRFKDGSVWEVYQITYFRNINGKLSCVLAGEGQHGKRIK